LIGKKRYYIMFVSRDSDGTLNKLPIPLRYAYMFVGAAIIGLFTITGLAGSYSRMLIKTARFNQLRQDHNNLQKDYVHLEKTAHERDVQAASLGSLATEVSALYGFTTSKLAAPVAHATGRAFRHSKVESAVTVAVNAPVATEQTAFSGDSYYKSIDAFYNLRTTALSGHATRFLPTSPIISGGEGSTSLTRIPGIGSTLDVAIAPTLWPVIGPITSGFGQREDPVLGNGEGEFHKGIDIAAPLGTPIRATADGIVLSAGLSNGYGREVVLDHGHGLKTLYGHMSGFNVLAGQTVFRGQIIGYVGHSGRTTGNHVHYEVKIRDTSVNPHKYLQTTLADLGGASTPNS
jgi:murein DD-endopeptidase MepM/ murein hydrolase activator NlpD